MKIGPLSISIPIFIFESTSIALFELSQLKQAGLYGSVFLLGVVVIRRSSEDQSSARARFS